MDWAGIALVAVVVVLGIGFAALMMRSTSAWSRRPRKPTRIRRARGEYQPPGPPEGRYWG